jgi:hypothetical protein
VTILSGPSTVTCAYNSYARGVQYDLQFSGSTTSATLARALLVTGRGEGTREITLVFDQYSKYP